MRQKSYGIWTNSRQQLNTVIQLLAFTLFFVSIDASPINRQAGISENVYITVQNDTYGIEQRVCSIESMTYDDGESIPTSSPCEHCICRPPGFACTIISCEYRPGCKALKRSDQCCPEYQCECEKNGKIYQNGEKILDDNNPCEVCYCQGGDVICAVIDCYWRSDCQPRYIENRCCPLYDHCPPPSEHGPIRPTQRPTTISTTTFSNPIYWLNMSSAIYATPSTSKRPIVATTEVTLPSVEPELDSNNVSPVDNFLPPPSPPAGEEVGNSLDGDKTSNLLQEIEEKVSNAPAVAEPAPEQNVVDPVIAEATPEQNVVDPVIAEATPEQNVVAPVIAEATPEQSVVAPVIAEATPEQNVVAPVIAEATPEQNVVAPVIAEATPEQNVVAPVIAEAVPEQNILTQTKGPVEPQAELEHPGLQTEITQNHSVHIQDIAPVSPVTELEIEPTTSASSQVSVVENIHGENGPPTPDTVVAHAPVVNASSIPEGEPNLSKVTAVPDSSPEVPEVVQDVPVPEILKTVSEVPEPEVSNSSGNSIAHPNVTHQAEVETVSAIPENSPESIIAHDQDTTPAPIVSELPIISDAVIPDSIPLVVDEREPIVSSISDETTIMPAEDHQPIAVSQTVALPSPVQVEAQPVVVTEAISVQHTHVNDAEAPVVVPVVTSEVPQIHATETQAEVVPSEEPQIHATETQAEVVPSEEPQIHATETQAEVVPSEEVQIHATETQAEVVASEGLQIHATETQAEVVASEGPQIQTTETLAEVSLDGSTDSVPSITIIPTGSYATDYLMSTVVSPSSDLETTSVTTIEIKPSTTMIISNPSIILIPADVIPLKVVGDSQETSTSSSVDGIPPADTDVTAAPAETGHEPVLLPAPIPEGIQTIKGSVSEGTTVLPMDIEVLPGDTLQGEVVSSDVPVVPESDLVSLDVPIVPDSDLLVSSDVPVVAESDLVSSDVPVVPESDLVSSNVPVIPDSENVGHLPGLNETGVEHSSALSTEKIPEVIVAEAEHSTDSAITVSNDTETLSQEIQPPKHEFGHAEPIQVTGGFENISVVLVPPKEGQGQSTVQEGTLTELPETVTENIVADIPSDPNQLPEEHIPVIIVDMDSGLTERPEFAQIQNNPPVEFVVPAVPEAEPIEIETTVKPSFSDENVVDVVELVADTNVPADLDNKVKVDTEVSPTEASLGIQSLVEGHDDVLHQEPVIEVEANTEIPEVTDIPTAVGSTANQPDQHLVDNKVNDVQGQQDVPDQAPDSSVPQHEKPTVNVTEAIRNVVAQGEIEVDPIPNDHEFHASNSIMADHLNSTHVNLEVETSTTGSPPSSGLAEVQDETTQSPEEKFRLDLSIFSDDEVDPKTETPNIEIAVTEGQVIFETIHPESHLPGSLNEIQNIPAHDEVTDIIGDSVTPGQEDSELRSDDISTLPPPDLLQRHHLPGHNEGVTEQVGDVDNLLQRHHLPGHIEGVTEQTEVVDDLLQRHHLPGHNEGVTEQIWAENDLLQRHHLPGHNEGVTEQVGSENDLLQRHHLPGHNEGATEQFGAVDDLLQRHQLPVHNEGATEQVGTVDDLLQRHHLPGHNEGVTEQIGTEELSDDAAVTTDAPTASSEGPIQVEGQNQTEVNIPKFQIPADLVKRVDPISDDIGPEHENADFRSDADNEVNNVDSTWYWRTLNRVRSLFPSAPLKSSRKPRSISSKSGRSEVKYWGLPRLLFW